MEDLFRKFLENNCSPEELKKLLSYFSNPENKALLKNLINESLINKDPIKSDGQDICPSANILNEIEKQIAAGNINLVTFLNKAKLQAAAVAVILLEM